MTTSSGSPTSWSFVRPDVEVLDTGTPPVIDPDVQKRVDAIWRDELNHRRGLFDGTVLCQEGLDIGADGLIERIHGRFVPYSHYLAARRDEQVADSLAIRALGVNAALLCREGLLIGRRAQHTTDPGVVELVPAGTIGTQWLQGSLVDFRACVLAELTEEVGLTPEDLSDGPTPFGLVEDVGTRVSDLVVVMRSPLSLGEIRIRFGSLPTHEHDEISALALDRDGSELHELTVTSRRLVQEISRQATGGSP